MFRKVLTIALLFGLISITGCSGGPKLVPVEGFVKLDGKPVEGATVTFLAENGSTTFSGTTDAAGHFALQSGDKIGAIPGTYKVTVLKSTTKPSAEAPDPGDAGMKQMKKDGEAAEKDRKAQGPDMKMKMGMMGGMKSGPKPGGSSSPSLKSELPQVYAVGMSTPLKATVPSDKPIELELKSKP